MAKSPLKELPKIYHSISSEWKPEFIGNLCKIKTGSSDTQDKVENGEYPFYVRAEEVQRSNKYIFDGQGILTAGDGVGVGKVFHLVDGKIDFHQRVYLLHDFSQRINQRYLYEYFKLNFVRQVFRFTAKTSVDSVRMDMISKMSIPIPPLEEQAKIAEILCTWDKSIEATEKLLENSKKRKKALMQQLLTGKKRLPGFSGEWRRRTLNSVADVIVSPVDKKTVEGQPEVVLCNYMDVYRNFYINKDIDFMPATATEKEVEKFSIRKGDVLITKDSETPDDIAVPSLVDEDLPGVVCGYHLAILRPKEGKIDGAYLSFLFRTPRVRHYFFTLANGATRFGLGVGSIQKAEFDLPSFEEQICISKVLRLCDDEELRLKEKVESLKLEKKALMQQLLTGKKRVKVEAESA